VRTRRKERAKRVGSTVLAAAALLTVGLTTTADPLEAKPPPKGHTYFTLAIGIDDPLGIDVACLRFSAKRVCLEPANYHKLCGDWVPIETASQQRGVAFEIEWDASGILARMEGEVRIADRGQGSSVGGAGLIGTADGTWQGNWSFAGRETKKKKCRRLMRDFEQLGDQWTASLCLQRAVFGEPASSPYVLPYSVGEAYRLGQSYCDPTGSHRDSFSYDFLMPIGTPIVAVRDGVVWRVIDEYEDGDQQSEHANSIWIEHADGSTAGYAHLQHESFLVRPGDTVTAGQTLGASGDTGAEWGQLHLHFEVHRSRDLSDAASIPVNFRNAGGTLDERGGLAWGETYEALPW
jgi:hypothetical protein